MLSTNSSSSSSNKFNDTEVGCCGDVPPKCDKNREKLLKWLAESNTKREENNKQVFSRWVDMVDNGTIDATVLQKYPNKTPTGSTLSLSPQPTLSTGSPVSVPTPTIISNENLIVPPSVPQHEFNQIYVPPYYSPSTTPQYWVSLPPYQEQAYSNQFYYYQQQQTSCNQQYIRQQQQQCACGPYIYPQQSATITPPIQQNESLDFDIKKWYDALNEIPHSDENNDNGSIKDEECN